LLAGEPFSSVRAAAVRGEPALITAMTAIVPPKSLIPSLERQQHVARDASSQ
jgi:hypothetical protein